MQATKLTFFLFMIAINVRAQSKEEVVQSVRDRYYRINGGDVALTKISLKGVDYFWADSKFAIAKKDTVGGRFEYYYDTYSDEYFPYFIYFESNDKSKKPDIRAYYGEEGELVVYKENLEEKSVIHFDHYYYYLLLDAKNIVNTMLNTYELAKCPQDERVAKVLQEVDNLVASVTQIDTLEYQEDGGAGGTFVYKNAKGEVVKKEEFWGGEHGSDINTKYYQKGVIIYDTQENESWVGSYTYIHTDITYYNEGKPFREDTYRSYGVSTGYEENEESGLFYSTDGMIPKIKYLDGDRCKPSD